MDFIDRRMGTGRCVVGGPEPKRLRGGVGGPSRDNLNKLAVLKAQLQENPSEENKSKIALINKYLNKETRESMTREELGQILRMRVMVKPEDMRQATTTPPPAPRPVKASLRSALKESARSLFHPLQNLQSRKQLAKLFHEPESEEAKEAAKKYEEQKATRAPRKPSREIPVEQRGPTCVHASILNMMLMKPELQSFFTRTGFQNMEKYITEVLPQEEIVGEDGNLEISPVEMIKPPYYKGPAPIFGAFFIHEAQKFYFGTLWDTEDDSVSDFDYDQDMAPGGNVVEVRNRLMEALNATGAQQGILVLEFTKSSHAIPWLKENDGFRIPESNNFSQEKVLQIIAGELQMNPDGRDNSPIENVEIYKFNTDGKGYPGQRLTVPLEVQRRLRNYAKVLPLMQVEQPDFPKPPAEQQKPTETKSDDPKPPTETKSDAPPARADD